MISVTRLLALVLAVLSLGTGSRAIAQNWAAGDPIIEARLLSDQAQLARGETAWLGIHQIMPEGWHTYWRNPGDNGLPIEITWDVPSGVMIGEISWPAPVELPLAGLIMDYGYKDEVTLPMPISVPADFDGDRLDIRAQATWLVCENVCIPEDRELSFSIPVGDTAIEHPDDVWYIRAALDAVPQLDERINAEISLTRTGLVLAFEGGDFADENVDWRDLKFFPFDKDLIEHSAEQRLDTSETGLTLGLTPGFGLDGGVTVGRGGLLSYEVNEGGAWEARAVEIWAEAGENYQGPIVGAAGAAGAGGGSEEMPSFWVLLALAFGGGLILNLMPCVFPILSIKVLNFVEVAHEHPARIRRHGLYFMAGVVLSFIALAGLLLILREVGLPVGWGFQLQTPIVVAILSLLFFAIGLNLLGVYELGTNLQNVGSNLVDKPGGRAAFFTGVLAVVVAAPCVGPLAAAALGLALTQPAIVMLLIAAFLGLGLAAPFVLFSFLPGLLRYLPRPGPWMLTFKEFLSFPMFASALWLAWVLVQQSGANGLLFLGIGALSLYFAIWAAKKPAKRWKTVGLLAALLVVFSTIWVARLPVASSTSHLAAGQQEWSRELVADLQGEGRAVFVDVTAAWCVTCQINKIRVLDSADVQAAFNQYGVAQLRADWTNRNEEIAELITEHGQAGVPLYLLYPADGGPALVLPTVLTQSGFIETLSEVGAN